MQRTTGAILLGSLLLIAPLAAAGHGGAHTVHRCYELGTSPVVVSQDDPAAVTCDGSIDIGGVIVEEAPPGTDSVQATIVDDLYGAGVIAGQLCIDENADTICGGPGEPAVDFCGTSPVVSFDPPATVVLFVGGPVQQAQNCDPVAAPTGATTGGVLSPNGGVFMTFS